MTTGGHGSEPGRAPVRSTDDLAMPGPKPRVDADRFTCAARNPRKKPGHRETTVAVAEIHTNVWEALAGRAPGTPLGPADPDLWRMVTERLNPARARPRLRTGTETAAHITARGVPYVMLRSPDR